MQRTRFYACVCEQNGARYLLSWCAKITENNVNDLCDDYWRMSYLTSSISLFYQRGSAPFIQSGYCAAFRGYNLTWAELGRVLDCKARTQGIVPFVTVLERRAVPCALLGCSRWQTLPLAAAAREYSVATDHDVQTTPAEQTEERGWDGGSSVVWSLSNL